MFPEIRDRWRKTAAPGGGHRRSGCFPRTYGNLGIWFHKIKSLSPLKFLPGRRSLYENAGQHNALARISILRNGERLGRATFQPSLVLYESVDEFIAGLFHLNREPVDAGRNQVDEYV